MGFHKLPEPDDNFRTEPAKGLPGASVVRRDFVPPIPVGSFIACVFRVEEYTPDCDGSAMAVLAQVGLDGEETGWRADCIGLYQDVDVVVDSPEDMTKAIEATYGNPPDSW